MRSIRYSVFGDQEEIAKHQQKELVITVNPRYCK
ncbi:hypothetical protein SAMN05428990_1782 [Pseudoxanthomonas sp. YR558]|nr:hypothetical protein SAMN05428990_1782 [Pseudoxanthomonas sp. YR558]